MPSKQNVPVECSNCGEQNWVEPNQTRFKCTKCGVLSSIIWTTTPTSTIQDLEEQVAALRKELKERGPLSQEQEKTLDAFLRQWMERNINQSASPLVDMSFLQLKVNFVPLSMVKELNESDLEAGVTFGMFTLFLGLAVQELLSKAAITSTVLVLFLATGILFGFTVYTLYKARVRKAEVEKNARDKSVPVKVIWGGKSTPEHER